MNESIHQGSRAESSAHSQDGLSLRNGPQARPVDDDRFPGSFFRVPGVPRPGNTTWSLAK
ncbi:MAG: hypothetical protein ACU836_10525 [Gammaproteobacteria bacterium]